MILSKKIDNYGINARPSGTAFFCYYSQIDIILNYC
jgi:hypothetical protein